MHAFVLYDIHWRILGFFWGVYVFDQFLFFPWEPSVGCDCNVCMEHGVRGARYKYGVVTDGVYICHFRYGEFDLRLPTSDTFHGSTCLCHTRVVMRSGVS